MSSPGRDFLNRHTYGGPECKDLYGQDAVDAFQKVKDLFGHDARIVDAEGLAAAIDTLLDKNARQKHALDILERKSPTEVRAALQATVNVTHGNYSEHRIAIDTPPQDSQTFFNVRIRWMEWTGKAPEMQDLIKTHTDKDGSIQHINDAIHSGGVGGCGAVFPKITIRDFATFCRKAEEYGYEVELVEAPAAEEANPFVVRAPV